MKVIKNFFLNSGYQLLLVLIPLITAPYISRVLGTHGVGLNTFTGTVVQYFTLVAVLGTSTYGGREIAYHQNNKMERSNAFWGITFVSWLTSLIAGGCFLAFVFIFRKYEVLFLWQGVAIFSAFFDISWYFRGVENFQIIVFRNVMIKILTIIAIFSLVHRSDDLIIYIIIISVGGLLGNLSLWPYLKKEINKPRIKKLNLRRHFYGSFLLFIPTIAVQVYTVVNKNMIGAMDSIVSLAYFNQANTLIQTALAAVSTLNMVMLPRTSLLYSTGDIVGVRKSIIKTFHIASGLAFPIYFGLSAISINFAPFFFGPHFKMVGIIMIIEAPIILLITASNIIGGQYLIAINNMRVFTASAFIGAVSNVLINLAFIPLFGVIGATIATVLSELFVISYQVFRVHKDISVTTLLRGVWKYALSGLVMFVIVFWMNHQFEMSIFQLGLQVFAGIVIYVCMNILLHTQLWNIGYQLVSKRKTR